MASQLQDVAQMPGSLRAWPGERIWHVCSVMTCKNNTGTLLLEWLCYQSTCFHGTLNESEICRDADAPHISCLLFPQSPAPICHCLMGSPVLVGCEGKTAFSFLSTHEIRGGAVGMLTEHRPCARPRVWSFSIRPRLIFTATL